MDSNHAAQRRYQSQDDFDQPQLGFEFCVWATLLGRRYKVASCRVALRNPTFTRLGHCICEREVVCDQEGLGKLSSANHFHQEPGCDWLARRLGILVDSHLLSPFRS